MPLDIMHDSHVLAHDWHVMPLDIMHNSHVLWHVRRSDLSALCPVASFSMDSHPCISRQVKKRIKEATDGKYGVQQNAQDSKHGMQDSNMIGYQGKKKYSSAGFLQVGSEASLGGAA